MLEDGKLPPGTEPATRTYVVVRSVDCLTVVSVCRGFPCGPICSDGPGPQPLSVHEGDGVLRLDLLGEGDKAVAFRL